jgi:hypothetical protein
MPLPSDASSVCSSSRIGDRRVNAVKLAALFALWGLSCVIRASESFTVVNDIEFGQFLDIDGPGMRVSWSPNGQYFAVQVDAGRMDIDRPESTVRIFSVRDVRSWLSAREAPPEPVWSLREAGFRNGPNLSNLRWLRDSRAVAYLAKDDHGRNGLHVADISQKSVRRLSLPGQTVTSFDVLDRDHFVYTVPVREVVAEAASPTTPVAIAVAGKNLGELLFPEAQYPESAPDKTLLELWAETKGDVPSIVVGTAGRTIHLQGVAPVSPALAMSPDGQFVVTTLALEEVPPEWEALYPPPYVPNAYHIHVGQQDVKSNTILDNLVRRYVQIRLADGELHPLLDSPVADVAGWWHLEGASWSPSARFVALSNVFLPRSRPPSNHEAAEPCIAAVELATGQAECVRLLKGWEQTGFEAGYKTAIRVNFLRDDQVTVTYDAHGSEMRGKSDRETYQRSSVGKWLIVPAPGVPSPLIVRVQESLSEPPVLMAAASVKDTPRALWDPNPGLKVVNLGIARRFDWKDAAGRDWVGGLYLPSGGSAKKPYPLVIQNHGFNTLRFIPSGLFTSVNAARELSSSGIAVLQVQDCAASGVLEAPCQIAGYESAVKALAQQGLIDPARLGIVGFSRTCYYVMAALTSSHLHFSAALISNGINGGYLQSLILPNMENDAESIIGGPPYGAGLQLWWKRSPLFNLDKVSAPLRIEASEGPLGLLFMWEPYAILTEMRKPVELIYYPQLGTHPLTNPAQRMASQGGSIDWFRYWLQDFEDPAPGKVDQYLRWRKLRDLQTATEPAQTVVQ